jgi:hypothetical protein
MNLPNEYRDTYVHRYIIEPIIAWASLSHFYKLVRWIDQLHIEERERMQAQIEDLRDRCVQPEAKYKYVVNMYILEFPREIIKIRFIRCFRKCLVQKERKYILGTDYKLVATFDDRVNAVSAVEIIKRFIRNKKRNVPVDPDNGYGPEKATIGIQKIWYPNLMEWIHKYMIKK